MIGAISPALEALLLPQERFESLYQLTCRRAAGSVCDLAYANPHDTPDPKVIAAIRSALERQRDLSLQYTPYGGSTITRRMIADRLAETHSEEFRWQDVTLTPGAMAGLSVIFRSLKMDSHDEVVVLTPCWMDYPLYLLQLGLTPVLVPLSRNSFRIDCAAVEKVLNEATRAIVFSHPANPTGVLYTEKELSELADVLNRRYNGSPAPPLIISDECHRDIVYEPNSFTSPLRYYDATVIVYSFGKALLMQGQRIGYVAVSPRFSGRECLRRCADRNCRIMGFCTPTALMQIAIRQLLTHRPNLEGMARRRHRITEALRAFGYRVVPSQATFFVYVVCPGSDDFAFAERLATEGVLVMPGCLFHDPGHFRLSVTASDSMIERALPVFESALKA